MILKSLIDQYTTFFGGPKLIDGAEVRSLANQVVRAVNGITAFAGGGQTNATKIGAGSTSVDTVASAADSVQLPPAIPGTKIWLVNNTLTSMKVFGVPSNINNGGTGDTIGIQGSDSQAATATGVDQAAGVKAWYVCTRLGQWDRGSVG